MAILVYVHGTNGTGKTTLALALIDYAGGQRGCVGSLTYTMSNLVLVGPYVTATGGLDSVQPYSDVQRILNKAGQLGPLNGKPMLVFAEGVITPGFDRTKNMMEPFKESLFIHLVIPDEQAIKHVQTRRDARGADKAFDPKNLLHKTKAAGYWAEKARKGGLPIEKMNYKQALEKCMSYIVHVKAETIKRPSFLR